jgi:enamine deaminase RidA (YjgF/YER057c/UK114 family)
MTWPAHNAPLVKRYQPGGHLARHWLRALLNLKRKIDMAVEEVTRYVTDDNQCFVREDDATDHQRDLVLRAVDLVLRDYSKENPEAHYPALSVTLIPFLLKHSGSLISALSRL